MQQTSITPVKHGNKDLPLSWFQERMWLLNRKNPEDLSYDIPVVFLLEGNLDVDALNKSISETLGRHETLRARFHTNTRSEVELSYTGDRSKLDVEVMYASDLYQPSTIEQLLRHHEQLLNVMMTNSKQKIAELTMLTEVDHLRLFIDFTRTHRTITNPKNFADRWDEQVQKTPDAIACYDTYGTWHYREIALAPNVTICTHVQQSKFGFSDDACCIVNEKLPNLTETTPVPPVSTAGPDDLAYLMYNTSGSTGIPKGARIPHRQFINWLSGIESNWPFTPGEVIAQKTTIAFAIHDRYIPAC